MENQEEEFDIATLEAHVNESLNEGVDEPEIIDEPEIDEPEFDLEAALDSFEPINLEGKISDEEARIKAAERGWNADGVDKYGHRISPLEFLERAPFFRKMELMRSDVDKANKALEKLALQNQQIAKKSIEDKQRMVEEFKAEKEKLLSEDFLDSDAISRVRELDKSISNTDLTETPDVGDEVIDYELAAEWFAKEHDWYKNNRAMTALADKVGTEYAISYEKQHGHLPQPEDLFKYVLEEVKKDFPDKAETASKVTRVATTNGRAVTNTNKPKRKTLADLPEDMRSVAREIMESSGLTEEDYLKTYRF